MKSHVQDGEVAGSQADLGDPTPFEVRVVRLLPAGSLTLNCVPCPVPLSLTAWKTARGFAVVSCCVCMGSDSGGCGKPGLTPFSHMLKVFSEAGQAAEEDILTWLHGNPFQQEPGD